MLQGYVFDRQGQGFWVGSQADFEAYIESTDGTPQDICHPGATVAPASADDIAQLAQDTCKQEAYWGMFDEVLANLSQTGVFKQIAERV